MAIRDALAPRAARERAARLAIYVCCEPLAQKRRVLDVGCGRGWGAAHLLAAGAARVTALEQSGLAGRAAQRFGRPGLDVHTFDDADLADLGPFDLVTCTRHPDRLQSRLESLLESMAPGSQLVLATMPATLGGETLSTWRERLKTLFLSVTQETQGVFEVLTASAPRRHLPTGPLRLHIGSGSQRLEDWVNVDIRPFPGVDLVADVNRGLDFASVDAVYAEHFLEHLAADDAFDFLAAIYRMLTPEGRLRLSTPNLDWVWRTHYRLAGPAEHKIASALKINRAFHGWEHKFLWNQETLSAALVATGFNNLRWYRHGESDDATFRGLERHETYGDSDDLPHVLIVEARRGTSQPEALASLRERVQREFLDHVAGY